MGWGRLVRAAPLSMSLLLVTGPVIEPVTLAEAKAHCRVEVPDDDALIAGYILAAREYAEQDTRRAFCTQTWDFKGHYVWPNYWDRELREWCTGIKLPKAPLQSVTSVNYVDINGATQLLAADQYQVVTTNGESREGVIVPAYGVTWPQIRDIPDAITVRFVAGYGGLESVPHRVRQAMLMLIGHWYENREEVITGTIVSQVPMAAAALLFPLRVF
jgi:uncharacterized phiE125 gp8 family phage protein